MIEVAVTIGLSVMGYVLLQSIHTTWMAVEALKAHLKPPEAKHYERWAYIRSTGSYEPLTGTFGMFMRHQDYCPCAEVVVEGQKRTLRLVIRDASLDFRTRYEGAEYEMGSPEYLVEIPCPDVGQDGSRFTADLRKITTEHIARAVLPDAEDGSSVLWVDLGQFSVSKPTGAPEDLERPIHAAQGAWYKHIRGE